jgi:DNA-binding response OmpR family regulator
VAKILIIDDEPDILFVLRVTLEAAGFDVVEASDGESGLEAVADESPDLVMTDLMMPLMDGHEVIRRIRSDPATASTPIVIVSAKPAPAGEADAIIRKPWRNDELIACLTDLLGRAS